MPRLLRGMARTAVVAGTATAVSNNVSRRQAARYAEDDAQQYAAAAPAAPADPYAELEKLSRLKDQGIVTQAEFDQKKAELLGL